MARIWLVLCFAIAVAIEEAHSLLPSPSDANVRFYLTKKGADYANVLMVNKTGATMEGQEVPPVSISKSIWWNTIRLSLTNSKMKSVSMGPTSIQFHDGVIKLSLGIKSAEVAGEYNYRGGILGSGKGTYSVKLTNVWISKFLSIGMSAEGKPYMVNGRCSNWIESISPEFTGGSSFIINLLVSLVKSSVNNDVRKKICTSITDAVDKGGKRLPNLYPEFYNVSRVQCAQVSFPILKQPSIRTDYIEFVLKGGISSKCYQVNSSSIEQGVSHIKYTPNPFKMISMVLSDSFINSMADLYYKAGIMKLAEIQTKHLLAPLRIALHLTSPPLINSTDNSSVATFNLMAYLTTFVVDQAINTKFNREVAKTFAVDLQIKCDFYLEEEDKFISGKVKNLRIIPVFTGKIPEKLKSLVVPVLKAHITQISNQIQSFLHKMAPLPIISNVHFTNKRFLYKEGYSVFESDVRV